MRDAPPKLPRLLATLVGLCAAAIAARGVAHAEALILSESHLDVSCHGGANGVIDLTVRGGTPPYAYAWNSGGITQDLIDIPAGNYSVLVTDAAADSAALTVDVEEPEPLVIDTVITNVRCKGGKDGAIALLVSGGTPPYSYNWGNGVTRD